MEVYDSYTRATINFGQVEIIDLDIPAFFEAEDSGSFIESCILYFEDLAKEYETDEFIIIGEYNEQYNEDEEFSEKWSVHFYVFKFTSPIAVIYGEDGFQQEVIHCVDFEKMQYVSNIKNKSDIVIDFFNRKG